MDISSFLLQPLQRITRYPLLIKKILEYTDEDHIDHLLLSEALVSAESFLDRINESIRSGEDKQKLSEIQRKLPAGDLSEVQYIDICVYASNNPLIEVLVWYAVLKQLLSSCNRALC